MPKRPFSEAQYAQVNTQAVPMRGGLDIVSAPLFAKPGTAAMATNFECAVGGGYEIPAGIERFDGQFNPNLAEYVLMQCTADVVAAVGDTLTGFTSGAQGEVIYVAGDLVAVTKVTGTFAVEALQVGAAAAGTVLTLEPNLDGFLDNELSALAAAVYRADIGTVPGFSRVRGLAVLNGTVYAWRDNVPLTAMVLFKSTPTGWQPVTLHHQVAFTAGSAAYEDGDTVTQGGVSATVMRVVVESGDWIAGNAAGRLIVTAPTGGAFAAGAAGGGGAVLLAGPSAQITLAPAGRVITDRYSFTARLEDQRLYGCDGVNPEFELADDVLVPLSTGMGSVRASTVKCHKNHLFFGYRGSLQHSGVGEPYKWSVVFGATELGTGDDITNLVSVGGSEDAAALMVLCKNAVLVLYGNSSANWNLVTLSRVSGAQPHSAHDIGGVVALDAPGFVRYPATQSFGNFQWDTVSQQIEPIARGQVPECSVFITNISKYRVFFGDGTAVSGNPVGRGQFEWSTLDYARRIVLAEHAEIDGVPRTFYADTEGWVYEADVGRSFAGDHIETGLKLRELNQSNASTIKRYTRIEIEATAKSALEYKVGGEFDDGEEEIDPLVPSDVRRQGQGLYYDINNFDQAYYDVPGTARRRHTFEGLGTCVSPIFSSYSAVQQPLTLRSIVLFYTVRRLAR